MRFADVFSNIVLNIFLAEDEESASQFATGEAIKSDTAQIGDVFDEETGEFTQQVVQVEDDSEEASSTEETPAE